MSGLWELSKRNVFSSPSYQTPSGRKLSCASVEVKRSYEYGSAKYFAMCGLGGMLSCSLTHTGMVPVDLIKCRVQVDPSKYRNLLHGTRLTLREEGIRALARGWAPTFLGYSMQGVFKFGLYEIFKINFSNFVGEENAYVYRTAVYLAASASAEFFADMALAPMEAVKVRIQTQPGWANTLRQGLPKLYAQEKITGFYKGLPPLWLRQIPYTMIKFAAFERTVEFLYKHVVPMKRSDMSKPQQLVVTFAGGYIAGVLCAVASHPPDTVVSKLNANVGSSALKVAKTLGWKALWKGLGARIIMVGNLTASQWFIYDLVKVYFRLPRPPPPEMPASLRRKLEAKEGANLIH